MLQVMIGATILIIHRQPTRSTPNCSNN